MAEMGKTKKLMAFFLVFTLVFGLFIPIEVATAAPLDCVETKVTDFTITNQEGEVPPDGFSRWQKVKLNISWDASYYQDQLKEGDYFKIILPNELTFPKNSASTNFNIYGPNGTDIVAKGVLTPQVLGGGDIVVTFTKDIEDRYNIKGSVSLIANFNHLINNTPGEHELEISIGSSFSKTKVKIKPPTTIENQTLSKWTANDLSPEGYVKWSVRINHKRGNLTNVVITDKLTADGDMTGIHYVPDSFILQERNIDEFGNNINSGIISERNVSNEVQITENGTAFSYTLGNVNGQQYQLNYQTTYREGLKLKNNVTLTSDEETIRKEYTFSQVSSNGQCQCDLTSKIKLIKLDANNHQIKLPNAVFRVTKPNGETFNLTTNAEGEVVSGKLIPGTYKVKEIQAPEGYELNQREYDAVVTSDGVCILEIENIPSTIEVRVKKIWSNVTGETPSIKLQLLKNGQKEGSPIELTNGNLSYTWRNLPKKDSHGNLYTYTVKEVGENNGWIKLGSDLYKVIYGGNQQTELTIENNKLTPGIPILPPKREIKVSKLWENSSGGGNLVALPSKVEVELLKNGVKTGQKLELKAENNWSGSFKNLPSTDAIGNPYYKYSVKEVGESGNLIIFNGKEYKVIYKGSMEAGYEITNQEKKEIPPPPPTPPSNPPSTSTLTDPYTVDIKVSKLWKDANGGMISPPTDKITVELYKEELPTGRLVELNAENNWSGVFKDVEAVSSLDNVNYEKYTVKEVGESEGKILFDGEQYKVFYERVTRDGFVITNEKEDLPPPSVPEVPNKEKPPVPPQNTPPSLPQTGDGINLSLYAWLFFMAGILLLGVGYKTTRYKR